MSGTTVRSNPKNQEERKDNSYCAFSQILEKVNEKGQDQLHVPPTKYKQGRSRQELKNELDPIISIAEDHIGYRENGRIVARVDNNNQLLSGNRDQIKLSKEKTSESR